MASDAKIGLLLGLLFIFIIALVINGLPSFLENPGNNELTANMVSLQNNPPAIAAKEREVINLREPVRKEPIMVKLPSAENQNIHIPRAVPEVAKTASQAAPVEKEAAVVKVLVAAQAVVEKDESPKIKPNKAVRPKSYVVREGDNLAEIAQKFYGSEEGNKKINIARIFEANRKALKSPDQIYVGQKLIIPPLSVSAADKGEIENVHSENKFAKAESDDRRRLLANARRSAQNRWYVVQEGDSLWQIAAEQLGDGNRYSEIAKINAGILEDEDTLSVGMRLRMPAR